MDENIERPRGQNISRDLKNIGTPRRQENIGRKRKTSEHWSTKRTSEHSKTVAKRTREHRERKGEQDKHWDTISRASFFRAYSCGEAGEAREMVGALAEPAVLAHHRLVA